MEHTKTPWETNNIKDDPNDLACAIWSADGNTPICTTRFSVGKYNEVDRQTQHANAAFIVRAVNCHADLLAALEEMRDNLDQIQTAHLRKLGLVPAMDKVNAAIAKAKGAL